MQNKLEAGLKTAALLGAGHGYVEAIAAASSKSGVVVRAEAGFMPAKNLKLFAFGEVTKAEQSAGVGLKWTF